MITRWAIPGAVQDEADGGEDRTCNLRPMSRYVLFVSPGLGRTEAAAARMRYEGDDERDDYLDDAQVRSVAEEIVRSHGMRVDSEDDVEPGSVLGLNLEAEGDAPGPEVRVDGFGVSIAVTRAPSATATNASLQQALAIARTASRLVDGAVYDTEQERMVEPSADDLSLLQAAAAALGRPGLTETDQRIRRAFAALLILGMIPVVGFNLGRRFLGGLPLFATVFGALVVSALVLSWWVKRPLPGVPPPLEAPSSTPSANEPVPFDDRPIRPG